MKLPLFAQEASRDLYVKTRLVDTAGKDRVGQIESGMAIYTLPYICIHTHTHTYINIYIIDS